MRTLSEQRPTAPLIERFQGGLRANADPRVLAERLLRGSELALEAARRDTADAMLACEELSERILALEAELAGTRLEPERLQGQLATERRARRLAEQQAHAERARRQELQHELASEREGHRADSAQDQVAEAEARRRELEAEAFVLRRQVDELGQLAQSARRARERAERRVAELSAALERAGAPSVAPTVSDGLAREAAVAGRPVAPSPPPEPSPLVGPDPQLALERHLALVRAGAAPAASPAAPAAAPDPGPAPAELRAELATLRATAERETAARLSVEARAAQLERELAEQIRRSSRAYEAIEELRIRLGAIGGWSAEPPPEPEPPASATEPESPASAAEPEAPAADAPSPAGEEASRAEPGPAPAGPSVAVEPERFNAALTRLREATPPEAGAPEAEAPEAEAPEAAAPAGTAAPLAETPAGPPRAWLPKVFRRLAREDPAAAGQLVLELLPAQLRAHPAPIAYDLELPGETCIRLTVADGDLRLELGPSRPPSQVRFTVTGDPAGLARLLAAGRLGRRLRRGLPKVTGDRRGLEALDALVRAPLSLRQLHDAGVRLPPRLALEVVARMIDPSWTAGSRFAIGYRPPGGEPLAYLEVGDGRPATVSEAAVPALVAGTITSAPGSLLAVLDGGEPGVAEFDGEPAQLSKLLGWVKRAQSD